MCVLDTYFKRLFLIMTLITIIIVTIMIIMIVKMIMIFIITIKTLIIEMELMIMLTINKIKIYNPNYTDGEQEERRTIIKEQYRFYFMNSFIVITTTCRNRG